MSEIHAGPLPQAAPDAEHHAGPLPVVPPAQRKTKRSWREKRWIRRRRRVWFEEVLGWILVPVILVALFWGAKATLGAFGTNFTALIQGISNVILSGGRGS